MTQPERNQRRMLTAHDATANDEVPYEASPKTCAVMISCDIPIPSETGYATEVLGMLWDVAVRFVRDVIRCICLHGAA